MTPCERRFYILPLLALLLSVPANAISSRRLHQSAEVPDRLQRLQAGVDERVRQSGENVESVFTQLHEYEEKLKFSLDRGMAYLNTTRSERNGTNPEVSHFSMQLQPPLWAIGFVFAISTFSQGLSGFGQAILFNTGMRLVASMMQIDYSPQRTMALLVIGDSLCALALMLRSLKDVDVQVLFQIGLPLMASTVVGNGALLYVDALMLQKSLGTLILLYSFYQIFNMWAARAWGAAPGQESGRAGPRPPCWMSITCGTVGGFVGGCTGMVGPPLALFFARTNFSKTEIRSTFTALTFAMNLESTCLLIREGVLSPTRDAPQYIMMLFSGVLGLNIGAWAHERVNEATVRQILLYLCLFAGCTMFGAGNGVLTIELCAGVFACLLLCIMGFKLQAARISYIKKCGPLWFVNANSDVPKSLVRLECRSRRFDQ